MSNERIDLNQFEAITKGPWRAFEDVEGAWTVGNQLYDLFPDHSLTDFSGTYCVAGICVLPHGTEANAKAIAALPELIVELKDLRWKHMQVLRERKDLRDECLRLARKLDKLRTTEEE